jgi:predicted nuclease of predicted toxin-antitoxin system
MKLLLDANLSWRLTDKLKPHFTDCLHVDKTGLMVPAKDSEIWAYALQHNYILVTNDDDFLDFARVKGFPPKVVLLRTGNQSNEAILSLLIKHQAQIALLESSEETGVLEIR